VTLMGGEFTPENESGECNPSSFWVPLRTSGGTAAPPPPPAAGMACRVLVVEDDLIAQRIVSHHLSRFGYDARVVSSGEEAVNEVVLRRYDVVLMDLQMPSMDGFETARRIREQPGCGEVPVIALTARADGMSRLTCLHQGMQAFLEKPLEAGKLAETIQRVLTKA
jgi:CheY-like chemotaxis protein